MNTIRLMANDCIQNNYSGYKTDKTIQIILSANFYTARESNIDLIWPIAFVGFNPLGQTSTQFIMP